MDRGLPWIEVRFDEPRVAQQQTSTLYIPTSPLQSSSFSSSFFCRFHKVRLQRNMSSLSPASSPATDKTLSSGPPLIIHLSTRFQTHPSSCTFPFPLAFHPHPVSEY